MNNIFPAGLFGVQLADLPNPVGRLQRYCLEWLWEEPAALSVALANQLRAAGRDPKATLLAVDLWPFDHDAVLALLRDEEQVDADGNPRFEMFADCLPALVDLRDTLADRLATDFDVAVPAQGGERASGLLSLVATPDDDGMLRGTDTPSDTLLFGVGQYALLDCAEGVGDSPPKVFGLGDPQRGSQWLQQLQTFVQVMIARGLLPQWYVWVT